MVKLKLWESIDPDLSLKISDDSRAERVKDHMAVYFLTDDDVTVVRKLFEREVASGLATEPSLGSLGMRLTFFTEMFDGSEEGEFVVLHLARRYLLVAVCAVRPGFPVRSERQFFVVGEEVRRKPYLKVFEFICECLRTFLLERSLLGQKTRPLAFCCDMPLQQQGIDSATVWYFTESARSFPLNCYNVGQCLDMVLARDRFSDVHVELVVVCSGGVASLVHACYEWGGVDVFVDLEEDTEMLYWEEREKVEKWTTQDSSADKQQRVLIDTELSRFGRGGCLDLMASEVQLSAAADGHAAVDGFVREESLRRLAAEELLALHHQGLYCRSASVEGLRKAGALLPEELRRTASDTDMRHGASLLPGGAVGGTEEDAAVANYVCRVLLTRAALLTGACLTTLLERCPDGDDVTVAARLFSDMPDHALRVRNALAALRPDAPKVRLLPVGPDARCEGAALAAALAARMK